MAKDVHFSSVVLAMHMDGTNGSTTFADSSISAKTVIGNGNAQISTAQSKFGGASAYFDGTGDYLNVASSTDFQFGTGDFTAELWIRRPALTTGNLIDVRPVGGGAGAYWALYFPSTTEIAFYSAGGDRIRTTHGMVVDTWYHIAVCRASGVTRLFMDGTQIGISYVDTTSYLVSPVIVCASAHALTDAFLNAYVDDLRITKGLARYTANFTPPPAPFPDIGYAVGGTVIDSNASPVARTLRVYRRDTGALLASGTSSPVTGAYSIDVAYDQEVNVVMLDDALGTLENDQILRTTPV